MGERSRDALRLDPGAPGLKVEFHGTKVTSDAGLLAYPSIEACGHWVWLMIRIAEKVGFLKAERSQSVQK